MWNEVYNCHDYYYGTQPNNFLEENLHLLQGKVLSLAEGKGRNAVFMAKNQLDVCAVDSSGVGLKKARQLATRQGVEIRFKVADLVEFVPSHESFDAVVSIFAHLPGATRSTLHQRVEKALKPGGIFLLEGYAKAQLERNTGGPKNPDMLFSLEELLADFSQSEVLKAQELERRVLEGRGHTGMAYVVQLVLRKQTNA